MPAPPFRYRSSIEKTLVRRGIIRAAVLKGAALGAAEAKRRAPIDERDYQNGIVAEVELTPIGWRGRLRAMDWKSRLIEYGTGPPAPTPAFAPVRKAAISVGLKSHGRALRLARG
jgi:hypothetical protein